jgi:outer membrane protein OmpA-like peptidoglycan-associated protein
MNNEFRLYTCTVPGMTILLCGLLVSCAPSTIGGMPSQTPQLYTQAQMMGLEDSDRINRFQRLAAEDGVEPPLVEQVYAPSGTVTGALGPVPVVKLTFDEGVFFAFNQDTPLPSSAAVLALIAQNMQKDVPDAAITIIGNTDAIGSDAYNDDLSERRAVNVMKLLAEDGVNPIQMTTVAVGDRQPVASNATPDGRARNRRVEFLISASVQANLAAVQYQHVDPAYFATSSSIAPTPGMTPAANVAPAPPAITPTVAVLQSQVVEENGVKKIGLLPVGPMQIEPASQDATQVAMMPLAPAPNVQLRDLQPVLPAQLNDTRVE